MSIPPVPTAKTIIEKLQKTTENEMDLDSEMETIDLDSEGS